MCLRQGSRTPILKRRDGGRNTADGERGKREASGVCWFSILNRDNRVDTRVDCLSKSATSYLKKKYPAHTKAIAACAIAATT